jgi:hypothetical protein
MTNPQSTNKMPLAYDDALVGVFLRKLAWEIYVAGGKPSVGEIAEQYVQSAREDLGLKKTTAGAPHEFIQSLRKCDPPLLDKTAPHDEDGWKNEWRLHYLPSHRIVRILSANPVVLPEAKKENPQGTIQYSVSLRSPALPKLLVTIGNGRPSFGELKGLYFLREVDGLEIDGLYIGKTNEFQTRLDGHVNSSGKKVIWWVFVAPEENNDFFSAEALDAAESLLISFWTEICVTTNKKRGKDNKPPFLHLQPAILFTEAASAAFLWLLRDKKTELKFDNLDLPFKDCKANHWPKCYLNPFNNSSEAD